MKNNKLFLALLIANSIVSISALYLVLQAENNRSKTYVDNNYADELRKWVMEENNDLRKYIDARNKDLEKYLQENIP